VGDPRLKRMLCRLGVEFHLSAQEIVLADVTEHDIAVGNRGFGAAVRITGRSRSRAGALRSYLQLAERVDARDRPATRAHRVDLDHGKRDVAAFDLAAR